VGFDDLDNDGDVDAVVSNSRGRPTLLRNDSPEPGHWLQVRLRGTNTNCDGVGARVKVVASGLTLIGEVHSGRGYQSHYGTRLYFGLGKRRHVDRIEVQWIGGKKDVFKNIAANQLINLVEGEGENTRTAKEQRVDHLPGVQYARRTLRGQSPSPYLSIRGSDVRENEKAKNAGQ